VRPLPTIDHDGRGSDDRPADLLHIPRTTCQSWRWATSTAGPQDPCMVCWMACPSSRVTHDRLHVRWTPGVCGWSASSPASRCAAGGGWLVV